MEELAGAPAAEYRGGGEGKGGLTRGQRGGGGEKGRKRLGSLAVLYAADPYLCIYRFM